MMANINLPSLCVCLGFFAYKGIDHCKTRILCLQIWEWKEPLNIMIYTTKKFEKVIESLFFFSK